MKGSEIVKYFSSLIEKGILPQSLILDCEEKTPCKFFAKEISKLLHSHFIEDEGEKKKAVNQIENDGFPDNLVIMPDGDTIKIDTMRDVKNFMMRKPLFSKVKSVIIVSAEKMGKEAQNSFLKILEEPPSYGYFILTIKEEGLLDTIFSRCQRVKVRVDEDFLEEFLKNKELDKSFKVFLDVCGFGENEELEEGLMKFFEFRDHVLKIISLGDRGRVDERFFAIRGKDNLEMLLKIAVSVLRDLYAIKSGSSNVVNSDIKSIIERMAGFPDELFLWKLKTLMNLKNDFVWNINNELFLIKLVEILKAKNKVV